jgi:hypothetical protein
MHRAMVRLRGDNRCQWVESHQVLEEAFDDPFLPKLQGNHRRISISSNFLEDKEMGLKAGKQRGGHEVREFGAVGCEGRGTGQTCIERFLWDRNTL